MALYQLDEFQGPELLGFVRSIEEPNGFIGQEFLPNQTINDITFEYVQGANEAPVMASVIGYGAEAPIEGRPPLGASVSGELPAIKRKAAISEKEIIRFLQPRAETNEKQQAIDYVYGLTARLIQGVHSRVEWLRIKALSEPVLQYDHNNVKFSVDYGFNKKLQFDLDSTQDGTGASIDVGDSWDEHETSTPLSDLVFMAERYKEETGTSAATLLLSSIAVSHILRSDSVMDIILGTNGGSRPVTRAELNTLLAELDLPTLRTFDSQVRTEALNGDISSEKLLDVERAVFLPDFAVGSTLFGPTAESRQLIGTPLASEAPGVYAVGYADEDPVVEYIKAAAIAFPTLPNAAFVGQAKVLDL